MQELLDRLFNLNGLIVRDLVVLLASPGARKKQQSTRQPAGGATGAGAHAAPLRCHSFVWPSFPNPGTCSNSKRVHLFSYLPPLHCSHPGRNDDRSHTWMDLGPNAAPFRSVLSACGPAAPLHSHSPRPPGLPPRAPSPALAVTWTSPPPASARASIYTPPRLPSPSTSSLSSLLP